VKPPRIVPEEFMDKSHSFGSVQGLVDV